MPAACPGDMFLATVKKGKPEVRRKVLPSLAQLRRSALSCGLRLHLLLHPLSEE